MPRVKKREVIYKKIDVRLNKSITAVEAKSLLGWQEHLGTNSEYAFSYKDDEGNSIKVKCVNNVRNRPLYRNLYETYKQEILRGRWRLNGETIIIGKTGLVLNGQHQLIALALAAIEYGRDPDKYAEWWQEEPTIPKIIVYGIDEGDEVVDTMDTCKPRSLMDVIYRSDYFANVKPKQRKAVSRMTDHAVRLLWHRTGASMDAYGTRRTHAEAIDFLNRHSTLLRLIKHIYEENGKDNISRYITPGYAAGMGYLMACAATDPDADGGYKSVEHPSEEQVDLKLLDKAEEFFVLLAGRAKDLDPLRTAFESFEESPKHEERLALIAKAWNQWSSEGKIEDLKLRYEKNKDGYLELVECPIVGGIDLGDVK